MGLPSAQLGSLPSMNVPSSIPVVGVQKSPKIWQQALLNILTQTAGAAATQGIGNVMSQDYAEDPATGWEKLTKGPRMDKSQKMQKTSLDAASMETTKGREFTANENRSNRELTASEGKAGRTLTETQAGLTRAQQLELAKQAETSALMRQILGGQQNLDQIFTQGQVTRENMGAASALDQNTPLTKSKVNLTNAQIEQLQGEVARQKAMQALLSGQKPGGPVGGDQAGAPRPPVQRTVGDGSGPFPQASDALASLYMALTADNPTSTPAVPPVDAGVPSPYVAMRLGLPPAAIAQNAMRAPAPDQSELSVLKGAPYSVRAQEIRRKYGIPE